MAIVGYSKGGKPIYGPPYTWEEEMDFYRRVGGATSLTIARGSDQAQKPAPARKSPRRRRAGSDPS